MQDKSVDNSGNENSRDKTIHFPQKNTRNSQKCEEEGVLGISITAH